MPSLGSRLESTWFGRQMDRQTASNDVHLHSAQTGPPAPARLADPFLSFPFLFLLAGGVQLGFLEGVCICMGVWYPIPCFPVQMLR